MKYCPICQKSWLERFNFCPEDAAPLSSTLPDPLIGKILNNKFEIVGKLGSGSSGLVYKAKHVLLDQWRAVKLLKTSDHQAYERELTQRILRAQNLRSENTVRLFDLDRFEDYYVIVEEFVEGHSLEDLLRSQGTLTPDQTISIIRQVCLSLEEAHRQHIYHLDLKPSNILLYGEGERVKVADYAAVYRGRKGNEAYCSPEQQRGEPLDGKSDVFALGLISYQMLTGTRLDPHTNNNPARDPEWTERLARGLDAGGIPTGLNDLISSVLRLTPEVRPDPNEILDTLRSSDVPAAAIKTAPVATPGKKETKSQEPVGLDAGRPLPTQARKMVPLEVPRIPEIPEAPQVSNEPDVSRERASKKKRRGPYLILLAIGLVLLLALFIKAGTAVGFAKEWVLGNDPLSLFLMVFMATLIFLYAYSLLRGARRSGGPKAKSRPTKSGANFISLQEPRTQPTKDRDVLKAEPVSRRAPGRRRSWRDLINIFIFHPPEHRASILDKESANGAPGRFSWREILSLIKPGFKEPRTQASLFHYVREKDVAESGQIQLSPELLELLAKQPKVTAPNLISSLFVDFSELGQDVSRLRRRRMSTAVFSFALHVAVISSIVLGILFTTSKKPEKVQPQQVAYLIEPPPIFYQQGERKDGGGGGGGGKREPTPPSHGRIPKTTRMQLVPPNPKPQPMTSPDTMTAEPSVVVPIEIPQDKSLPIGDITAPPEPVKTASGPGSDGGIGTGQGTGVGPGRGSGVGPGSGGGIGGGDGGGVGSGHGPYIAGYPGLRNPVPIHSPAPSYTEEGRKAKIEGVVVLRVIVRKDGRVDGIKVIRSLGYGLDEAAVQTVATQWRFQPGILNGQPVDVHNVTIEVNFRLL